jgi:mannose-6-phosphate isomerase-like protein (cupin superfamily)
MSQFHLRKLPDFSTLICGRTPPDEVGFESEKLWVWYINTEQNWASVGETSHMHTLADECFLVLSGTLIVEVAGGRFEVGPREFCCFPAGVYHAIVDICPPVEMFAIKSPSVKDKVYQEPQKTPLR